MEKYLEFVTVDFWTVIFTWVNLFILFLLLKKFLFKPIKNVLDAREQEISNAFNDAEAQLESAKAMEAEYKEKLSAAKDEANNIVKTAERNAELKSEDIINNAKSEAAKIIEKADLDIAREKKNAVNDIKNDISAIAVSIAEKVIEKDIDEKKYDELIEEFINDIGEVS